MFCLSASPNVPARASSDYETLKTSKDETTSRPIVGRTTEGPYAHVKSRNGCDHATSPTASPNTVFLIDRLDNSSSNENRYLAGVEAKRLKHTSRYFCLTGANVVLTRWPSYERTSSYTQRGSLDTHS